MCSQALETMLGKMYETKAETTRRGIEIKAETKKRGSETEAEAKRKGSGTKAATQRRESVTRAETKKRGHVMKNAIIAADRTWIVAKKEIEEHAPKEGRQRARTAKTKTRCEADPGGETCLLQKLPHMAHTLGLQWV